MKSSRKHSVAEWLLIPFLHIHDIGASQPLSAEMTLSWLWRYVSITGEHGASLSLSSWFIFMGMEIYPNVSLSLFFFFNGSNNTAVRTEYGWSYFAPQGRHSDWERIMISKVVILVFSMFLGTSGALLCQDSSGGRRIVSVKTWEQRCVVSRLLWSLVTGFANCCESPWLSDHGFPWAMCFWRDLVWPWLYSDHFQTRSTCINKTDICYHVLSNRNLT